MNHSTGWLLRQAHACLQAGQMDSARKMFESILAQDPTDIQSHLVLGGLAWKENRIEEAIRHAHDAAQWVTDDAALLGAVIAALIEVGEHAKARECLQRPILAQTEEVGLLQRLAGWQQSLGDHAAALASWERAGELGADGPGYRFHLATQLAFNGRLNEAEVELECCVGYDHPMGRAWLQLARLRLQTPMSNHLPTLERMLARVQRGSEDHAGLEFARYKEFEDLGRHDEAWLALAHGNALMAARTAYAPLREQALFDRLRSICTETFMHSPTATAPQGAIPIFIIGMTRSGTTLLDRIIGNHSEVESVGELKDFGRQLRNVAGQHTLEMIDEALLDRLSHLDLAEVSQRYLAQTQWRTKGKRFFIDKLPPNWQLAGLIGRALPQARILHLVRDPMDVCFSNFRALFGDSYSWSYDLRHLSHHYREYRRTMAHWHAVMPGRILDVSYADLVRAPASTASAVFGFCGLADEEHCEELSRNTTSVATLSMAQVRGAIHDRAFGEWRPYGKHLSEWTSAFVN